jgi:galactonate dehydratase
MKTTKIEKVETLRVDKFLYVQITTDTGITGLGEAGMWGYVAANEAVVKQWTPYLIGKDPLATEHHWNYLYRVSNFRGGAVTGALGGIDAALWDIMGKHYGVPIHRLLGGPTRHKVRIQKHVNDRDIEDAVKNAKIQAARGVSAIRVIPFSSDYASKRYDEIIKDGVAKLKTIREAVGDGIDLTVEAGRHLSPAESIIMATEMEPWHPIYFEDPCLPDSIAANAEVARSIRLPVAAGERLTSIWEFRELLTSGGARYVRLDLGLAGGLTPGKKIAALCEAFHVDISMHGGLSPVATALQVQLAASIPNFVMQDYAYDEDPPCPDLLVENLTLENGYVLLPDKPGLGVELKPGIEKKYPPVVRPIETDVREDGSVAYH